MAGQYLRDLLDQPRAIRDTVLGLIDSEALRSAAELDRPRSVVLTGMGSSFYALYGLFLRLLDDGLPTTWIETSELLHHARGAVRGDTLLVVASQSGETVEVVRLLEGVGAGTRIVGITNHPDSTLGQRARLPLPLAAGDEGIVANKTYVATAVAAMLLGNALTGRHQPSPAEIEGAASALEDLLGRRDELERTLIEALGDQPTQLFLIGRGPSYGSALTGALMLKEGSHTPAQALSGAAFRHGPLEMTSAATSALLFAPRGPGGDLVRSLAVEMTGYGARAALVGEGIADLPTVATPPLAESVAPLVEIVAAELLVVAFARAAEIEPGDFRRTGKVTTTE
jgi:glucosamine--fructose-6-phosphate aminotransferase (isomerizing)